MTCQIRCVLPAAALLCLGLQAMSISYAHADGFNSAPGITTTPFGSNGATVMDIYSKDATGTQMGIGMGTATPQATLDVAGTIRPGSVSVAVSGACTPEGSLSYDKTSATHQVVYCDSTGHWAASGDSIPGSCTLYCYPPSAGPFGGHNSTCIESPGALSAGMELGPQAGMQAMTVPTGTLMFNTMNNSGASNTWYQVTCINGTWANTGAISSPSGD